jgi:two-component system KDP operon response regulator KdpE
MRVALRHAARTPDAESACAFGDVRADPIKREVSRRVAVVHLTPRECKLLVILVKNADRVVTHRQLLCEVWWPNAVEHTHHLRLDMAQLRQKLEVEPARPRHLTTEAGVGYR